MNKNIEKELFDIPLKAVINYLKEMMKFSDDVPVKNALLLLCGISIETYFTTDPDESIEPFIKHFQKLLKNYNHDEIYEITIKRKI